MLEVKHFTDVMKKMLSTVYLLQDKKIEASFLLNNKTPNAIKLMSYLNLLPVHAQLGMEFTNDQPSHHRIIKFELCVTVDDSDFSLSHFYDKCFPCLTTELKKITIFVALADNNFLQGQLGNNYGQPQPSMVCTAK